MSELSDKPKIIYLLGPTGVGKTDAALSLAAAMRAEVVSADSMQVYRYMDIGTAKPTTEQRGRVAHHLIDLLNPDQIFNVSLFCEHAHAAISETRSRGHNVLVCGGSGLYLKALGGGLFTGPGRDETIRRQLREVIRVRGLPGLVEDLRAVDPETVTGIDAQNERRVIRAMEVFELTGRPLSAWHRDHRFKEQRFRILKIGMDRPRTVLYDRIDARCEAMLEAGFVEEVAMLLDRGYSPHLPSLQSVGYRQMLQHLTGQLNFTEAAALMRRDTRRLAKRQLTWFRADAEIRWLPADELGGMMDACQAFLQTA